MRRHPRRWQAAILAVAVLATLAASPAAAAPGRSAAAGPPVTVMTQNVYFGADLFPLLSAETPTELAAAAAGAFQMAMASDFPGRADAIAASIAEHQPALVGIQEATVWSTGPFMDPDPADTVEADFVQLILQALSARGMAYEVAVRAPGFEAEAPAFAPPFVRDVRLQIADVILARTDLPDRIFEVEDTHWGRYTNLATIPLPTGNLPFHRQWAAVDATSHGRPFRFVTTHLEVLSGLLRTVQAGELLAATASDRPTIYVGDFNDTIGEGEAADLMAGAGLTEVWGYLYPNDPGPTSGQAADLRNVESQLDRRIDLVFADDGWRPLNATIVGEELEDKTPSGLWPSDHAGVVAKLKLESPED